MQFLLSYAELLDVYEDLCELHRKVAPKSAPMGQWRPDGPATCQSTLGALTPSFGVDRYPSIEDKAARILTGIVCGHPLVDGNKRLGVFAAHRQFLINGYSLDISDDDLTDIAYHVVEARTEDRLSIPRISEVVAMRFAESVFDL